MKAEIISIGAELLLGQIANTDAQYLSATPVNRHGYIPHTVMEITVKDY